jgi:hypothetical protein
MIWANYRPVALHAITWGDLDGTASGSFLKKRTKKLLLLFVRGCLNSPERSARTINLEKTYVFQLDTPPESIFGDVKWCSQQRYGPLY